MGSESKDGILFLCLLWGIADDASKFVLVNTSVKGGSVRGGAILFGGLDLNR